MIELEEFIAKLRELAAKAPSNALVMPENNVGLPVGTFISSALLFYIAECLEGKVN